MLEKAVKTKYVQTILTSDHHGEFFETLPHHLRTHYFLTFSTENLHQRPLTPTLMRTMPFLRLHQLIVSLQPHVAGLVLVVLGHLPMAQVQTVILGGMIGVLASAVGGPHLPVGLLKPPLLVHRFLKLKLANKYQQQPNPSNVLGVFGLSIRTQERDLEDEFCRFGRVEKVTIVYDQRVRTGAYESEGTT